MVENRKLVEGPIVGSLIKLALPIMATAFVQMAYNMMDMMWLGRLSTEAVAAAGTAGFLTWFGSSLLMIPKIGAEVGVAQAYGRKDMDGAKSYVRNALWVNIIISLVYSFLVIVFRHQIVGFFDLGDSHVIKMTLDYLYIVAFGMIFFMTNPVLSGIYNGAGDGVTPFRINVAGLVVNMVLDPIMIFGLGPIPALGIKGAAYATVLAQVTVTAIFLFLSINKMELFTNMRMFKGFETKYVKEIFKLGVPSAVQNASFTGIAILLAKIIAQWGPKAIAVQKIGVQVESITWMTAGGFSTAISAFVGQNYGANKWERIKEGYKKGMAILMFLGLINMVFLYIFAEQIFRVFIPKDIVALKIGIQYLTILSLSQVFMCMEIGTQGAFNGIGKTMPPALIAVIFNFGRIPAAMLLSKTALDLNGVWWSISVSSMFKGTLLMGWFIITMIKMDKKYKETGDFKLRHVS